MSDPEQPANLPAQIAAAIAGLPAALVPACVRALDRLIGAAVDVPVAWLEYQKAKIVSQTEAFRTIDGAITAKAAEKAGANEQFSDRALNNIIRKSYRQLNNKEAVSSAMLEDLRHHQEHGLEGQPGGLNEVSSIDDDWLNVFERYAEDASTERMQKLWGRVLAGEIRSPGKYGLRTLRFLSEFSQSDALTFSEFCKNCFGDMAPRSLIVTPELKDMRHLIYLEASGLIQGASGIGLSITKNFNENGESLMQEGELIVLFTSYPMAQVQYDVIALTPLGQELVSLLPGRDAREAARSVARAYKVPQIKSAVLMTSTGNQSATTMEILWQEVAPAISPEGSALASANTKS